MEVKEDNMTYQRQICHQTQPQHNDGYCIHSRRKTLDIRSGSETINMPPPTGQYPSCWPRRHL